MKTENIKGIKTVAVVGAGGMGEGIALTCAQAGLGVRVVTRSNETMVKCMAHIDDSLKLFKEFGLIKEDPSTIRSRVQPYFMADLKYAVKDCDFIVESVPEVLEAKRELFEQLDNYCEPRVIISSNTSSFPVNILVEKMKTPERVIGTHFFMPAHIIPLVEIHWGEKTAKEVIDATWDLMVQVGKTPILVRKPVVGFVVNRIQNAIVREAHCLIDQGVVTVEDFDRAAKASYGFRLANLGPLAQLDINGLDVVFRGNTRIYKELCNTTELSPNFAAMVARGDLGLKSGKGYYDYTGQPKGKVQENIERNLLKQLILYRERENPVK